MWPTAVVERKPVQAFLWSVIQSVCDIINSVYRYRRSHHRFLTTTGGLFAETKFLSWVLTCLLAVGLLELADLPAMDATESSVVSELAEILQLSSVAAEELRLELQPGLDTPMPKAKPWSMERERERKIAEKEKNRLEREKRKAKGDGKAKGRVENIESRGESEGRVFRWAESYRPQTVM